MPPLAIMGGIMAAGGLASAAIGANAAGNAADAQANAAIQAANIQANQANKALDFQKAQYATGQQELAPWLQGGAEGLAQLMYGLGLPVSGNATIPGAAPAGQAKPGANIGIAGTMQPGVGGNRPGYRSPLLGIGRGDLEGAMIRPLAGKAANPNQLPTQSIPLSSFVNKNLGPAGYLNFTAPTAITEQNDPGYKARLAMGTDALQRSAAAKGGLLTGGTARALDQFSQDYASNEYQNVYDRALTQNTLGYNRLAQLAGVGQTAGSTMVGAGNNSANSIANTLLTLGEMQGQGINNAAAARGSGYLNQAGAWGGALNGMTNNISQLLLLKSLMGGGSGLAGYGNGSGQVG